MQLPKNGAAVRRLRKRLKLTQPEFAALVGIGRRTQIRFEQAESLDKRHARMFRDVARDKLRKL